jgi:hypothetical protein
MELLLQLSDHMCVEASYSHPMIDLTSVVVIKMLKKVQARE